LIYEPGLKELLKKNLNANRLHFTLEFDKAIPASDIVFIAVGTPPKDNGEADLSSVLGVAESIGRHLKQGYTVVSCKSTVPVGTNLKVEKILNDVKPDGAEVDVVSCPEFLREGTGIYDTINPDRVVVGSKSQKAIDFILELHKPLSGERVVTDLASAEIIKYASNAMLATKISFANLISLYAEATGADIETIMDAVGADNRIGRKFLYAGIGYGGSCFPKDVMALTETGKQLDLEQHQPAGEKSFYQKCRRRAYFALHRRRRRRRGAVCRAQNPGAFRRGEKSAGLRGPLPHQLSVARNRRKAFRRRHSVSGAGHAFF